jgi:hypothetical protein
MAVVLPWWIIYGSSSSPKIETSTNLYLTPLEMVTITSTTNIIAGELTTFEKTFELVIGFLPILIVLGCIGIIFSMILNHLNKKIFSKLLLLGGLLVLISCLLIFSIGMSQLAEIGVGSFIGSGDIEINIPGEGIYEILSCSWGPAIGFYLLLISVIILFILTFLSYKGCLLDKFKKIYIRKI